MKNILITSAGQRVSLVRAFQKEANKVSQNLRIFTVDVNPVLAPACHISDGFEKIVHANDTQFISNLLSICKKMNVGIIIPTIDTELLKLAENIELFEKENIKVIISASSFIQKCRDKRVSADFFVSNGISIPKAVSKVNPTFPLFIKPYDGSLSKDIFVIKESSELNSYHLTNEKLIFMEFIDPELHDEYTVDAYYNKEHLLCCAVPRKRIFVRSGEINKGVTRKNQIVAFLKEKLNFIEGAIGCLTIQVFFNKISEEIIGIEINPRFGGGFPLSYLAGANFPKWIIDEYLLNKNISYNDDWEDNLLMLRYDDEVLVHNYEE